LKNLDLPPFMMISTYKFPLKSTRQHLQPYSYPTTLDTDDLQEPPSLSSSPISQYSSVYHTGPESHTPFSASGGIPAIAIPRSVGSVEGPIDGISLSLSDHTQLMNPGDWNPAGGPFRPKLPRGDHNRESSLSSLGSVGPTSPYSHSGITPRIAIADAGQDGLNGMPDYCHDGMWPESNYALDSKARPIGHASEQFFPGLLDGQGHHGMHFAASAMAQRHRIERSGGLAPPADFPSLSRHGAESVASSTIGGDSPATPALGEPIEDRRRPDGEYLNPPHAWPDTGSSSLVFRDPPKFERSITDACQDSIYSHNMAVGSSSPSQSHFSPSSQFSRAIEAANSQHLNVDQAPNGAFRRSSPFRNGSSLAPMAGRDFPPASQYSIAAPRRSDLHTAIIHGDSPTVAGHSGTPQTISPKDAMIELDDVDGDNHYALFPTQPTGGYGGQHEFMRDASDAGGHLQYIAGNPTARVPQQYPFVPSPIHTENTRRLQESPSGTPRQATGSLSAGLVDDGGTYSCTYHGCKLRFNTQQNLQNHKREGHRAAGVSRRGDRGQNHQHQHGPHICNRINPSTNKVCGSKFSRPYDLTRHEDTIHNASKKKLRCRICPEEKLFSRRDALNRHFKVCHEELYDIEFPRRRRVPRS
jgi:hypothetical protein